MTDIFVTYKLFVNDSQQHSHQEIYKNQRKYLVMHLFFVVQTSLYCIPGMSMKQVLLLRDESLSL